MSRCLSNVILDCSLSFFCWWCWSQQWWLLVTGYRANIDICCSLNPPVKGVNIFGLGSEYVVSGSDCGHVFLWDKEKTEIVQYFEGDQEGVVSLCAVKVEAEGCTIISFFI